MALQQVNFGSASDGSQGDTARAAFGKINANFSDTTNAASRLVGTAAGQVMEVGAFGVGSAVQAVSSDDLNTYQTAGQRKFTNATAANVPYAEYGYLHVEGVGDVANRVAQTWVSRTNRRFSRTLQADGWTVWREIPFTDSPSFSNVLSVISNTGNAGMRLGRQNGATSTPYIDVVSGGANIGYDTRLIFKGGSPSGTAVGTGQLSMLLAALAVGTESQNNSDRLTVAGAASASGPFRVGQYTLASLPSAAAFSGYEIDVTDAAGGAKRCRSDGTNWKIINTTTTVS